jgi:serine/threonine protein kinase
MSAAYLADPSQPAPEAPGRESAGLLVEELRARFARGEPAGARDVLARHPGLTADKQLLIDLACEEFSQRHAAGERLTAAEFAARFPDLGASLRAVLEVREFFEDNPSVVAEDAGPGMPCWPAAGELLHGFVLLGELGRGSFARVFLAQQPEVANRHVVVKVSFQDAAQEADALGRLCHPNIVPILSVHGEKGAGWMAVCMPYHGTATLADVLERVAPRGRLPRRADALLAAVQSVPLAAEPAREGAGPHPPLRHGTYLEGALHLAAQLADAVAYVHEHGICHRDLKPANVLLTPSGRPLLLDFNLSGPEKTEGGDGGTLPYMAPEQIRALLREAQGADVDARCDVYALGILLHQLLTGRHPLLPFPAGLTRRQLALWLVQRQQAGAPAARKANPRLDPAVARLLDRCLAEDPARRPSARELADALRDALSLPRRLVAWLRGRRKALFGAAAVALFALLVPLFAPLPGRSRPAERAALPAPASPRQLAADQFARGRDLFRLGKMDEARSAFFEADRLAPDGKVKAALAASYHKSPFDPHADYDAARYYYEKALAAGYRTARVYNNLAYCQAMRGAPGDALATLRLALRADPKLQAAYFNRVFLSLRLDLGHQTSVRFLGVTVPVSPRITLQEVQGDLNATVRLLRTRILPDTRKALELGPPSGELHLCAARVFALVAYLGVDSDLADEGLYHANKAVDLGCHPRELRDDPILAVGLRGVPGFQDIVNRDAPNNPAARDAVRFLDPIED